VPHTLLAESAFCFWGPGWMGERNRFRGQVMISGVNIHEIKAKTTGAAVWGPWDPCPSCHGTGC
jgi:hypothetical protein